MDGLYGMLGKATQNPGKLQELYFIAPSIYDNETN
jgi:hypothetical protein